MSDLAEKVQRIKPAEKFRFGEWLPDEADLDNPGVIEANNLLWSAGSYIPYNPFIPSGFQLPGGTVLAAARGTLGGPGVLYVVSTDGVSNFLSGAVNNSFNFVNITGPALQASTYATFAQFGNAMYYADGVNPLQYNGLDANLSTQFAKVTGPYGDAPTAVCVGVFGQFVILGNLPPSQPSTLRWSSINQPFNWPTPGSANAIASQAGQQTLDYVLGSIYGIAQGDSWGLVICRDGLERVQYIGGDTVFQFSEIYRGPAAIHPSAWVKFGGRVYLCSADGFLVTDGVSVQRIGDGRIDRWFLANVGVTTVCAGVDSLRKLIYWTFPLVGTGSAPNAWIAYNFVENRWTHGTDGLQCFVKEGEVTVGLAGYALQAFSSAAAPQGGGYGGTLSGTPTTAVITTPEIELNPGGRALLQGFRPQIAGLTGSNATVRIGSRTRLSDQVIYTPSLTVNGQTNFADALVDANYHRAEITLNGNFNQAIGGEFKAEPTGEW